MKNKLLFITMLCVSHIMCFAQVKVNSTNNAGIGNNPNPKAKLLLYNSVSAADTIFGLHSFMDNTNNNNPEPLYGAYFKNRQSNPLMGTHGKIYGIYLDNENVRYGNSNYGVYTNNVTGGYSGSFHGFYANNTLNSGYSGSIYGFYANNTCEQHATYSGSLYGAYLNNNKSSGVYGYVYGIYSTNTIDANENSQTSLVYGAYLSATSLSASKGGVYGIYSTVSGSNVNNRYAGYFTGGKVVMTNAGGSIGLEVQGDVWANNFIPTSDERLKTDIKPLSDEKDKLYLLQGKSYKKKIRPIASEEDSLAKEMEIIEMPEYGYLAQELKEIFPDLVKQSQDSGGCYGVNYIGLIPVIVEALKDQRLENEKKQRELKEQIDEQREQIKQLVKLIDIKSINEKAFEENGIETIPILLQNTPNPFNQATEIGYYIPETVSSANIYIYDINGFQQKNILISERGKGATTLQASALQAGIYFYTLICDGKPVDTKQMILTR